VLESPSGDVQLQGTLPRNRVRDWIVYSRKKNLRKGNVSLRRSDYVMAEEEGVQHAG